MGDRHVRIDRMAIVPRSQVLGSVFAVEYQGAKQILLQLMRL